MSMVLYLPGDGTDVELDVAYIADYPRAKDSTCAFCLGDPCAEKSLPESRIAAYYVRNPQAETCPMCDGKPS